MASGKVVCSRSVLSADSSFIIDKRSGQIRLISLFRTFHAGPVLRCFTSSLLRVSATPEMISRISLGCYPRADKLWVLSEESITLSES